MARESITTFCTALPMERVELPAGQPRFGESVHGLHCAARPRACSFAGSRGHSKSFPAVQNESDRALIE
jgi:hypothetical protein